MQDGIENLRTISLHALMFPFNPCRPRWYPLCRRRSVPRGHPGAEAAAAFQTIIDHPGLILNFPSDALAHLGLGRAYAMQGDTAKARAAYQDFLTLWKDADQDIPMVMSAAKKEFAALH